MAAYGVWHERYQAAANNKASKPLNQAAMARRGVGGAWRRRQLKTARNEHETGGGNRRKRRYRNGSGGGNVISWRMAESLGSKAWLAAARHRGVA